MATKELDRRFPGVGRVRVASGTSHAPTFRRMNEMLTVLYQTGRLDLVRAIRDKVLEPLRVYDAYRTNRLETLPTPEMMVPLKATWTDWLARHEVGDKTRQNYGEVAIHLDAVMSDEHTLEDLPGLLGQVRAKLVSEGKAATFNRLRSACQAFMRVTLGEDHHLWLGIKRTKKLKETAKRVSQPQTVAQMDALPFSKVLLAHLWSMASTGMGPGEYWGKWEHVSDTSAPRIHIHGTKASGRERVVPDLGLCAKPTMSRNAFRQRLQRARRKAGLNLSMYDLRHSFATWMEDARIAPGRLRSYMGHGKSNVTDIYTWREVRPYLAKDARRLLAFLRHERAVEKAKQREAEKPPVLKQVPGKVPGLRAM